MRVTRPCTFAAAAAGLVLAGAQPVLSAPFLLVGLDQKASWDPTTGRPTYSEPGRDSVVVVDLAKPEAPKIVATLPLENSVTGPPTNLAIAPDNSIAVIANSVTNTS